LFGRWCLGTARLLCLASIQHLAAVAGDGLVRHLDAGILVQHGPDGLIGRLAFPQGHDGVFDFVQRAVFFRRGWRVIIDGFG